MRHLYLFDIDGTLIHGGTQVHREAFAHVYRAVYDLPLSLDGVLAAGRTDTWLLAEPLRRHGLPDEEIWTKMPAAFGAMEEYVEKHLGDLRDRVLPGVPEVLEGLQAHDQALALLTGNLCRIAHAKMRHAGLDAFFATGGFGEESEVRAYLVPVALANAAHLFGTPVPAASAAVIGDTPMDVEAGATHGARTVAVATGQHSLPELRATGADLVLPSFADHDSAVAALLHLFDEGIDDAHRGSSQTAPR